MHKNTLETGLGTMLLQYFNGEEHMILYVSRKLTPTEWQYVAME